MQVEALQLSASYDAPMHGVGLIERAFQLAERSQSIDEIRKSLIREGYSSVEAHLSGQQIKRDLIGRLRPNSSESA